MVGSTVVQTFGELNPGSRTTSRVSFITGSLYQFSSLRETNTVLCKRNVSEMCKIRSLLSRTFLMRSSHDNSRLF